MQADYLLDYSGVPGGREQHLYLLARLQADTAPGADTRRPLNLSLVLDRSGSMQGDKLVYVKKAAQYLVRHLGGQDRLSVVSYNEEVSVDAGSAVVAHKDQLLRRIEDLRAGGTTNLSGGWLQGCQLVAEHSEEGQINRVLLLTDGLANQGVTEPAQLERMARQKHHAGITTTTMGVGLNFNEDLLTRMAAEGGGAYYFIDDPDQAPVIFREELQDLLKVVGQNFVVTLTLGDDVRMVRQLNDYPVEKQDGALTFRMGDVFSDEVKTLLLELAIPPLQSQGDPVEIGRLGFELDGLNEAGTEHLVFDVPLTVEVVTRDDFKTLEREPEVVRNLLILQAARAREEAIQFADRGDFNRASQVLRASAEAIRSSDFFTEPEMRERHDMLREESVDMELGSSRYDARARKASMTKSHYEGTRPFGRIGETRAMHSRLKRARAAIERRGETPGSVTWSGGTLQIEDRLRIGRSDDNDITVAENEVSKYHCEVVRVGADLLLKDLNSKNGTFANGGRVSGRFRLSVGDVVTVGSELFMFEAAQNE